MGRCDLGYIPERLHWDEKSEIDVFQIGDLIYRRCKPEELDNPFGTISLREISNNIGTSMGVEISQQNDVMYNIDPNEQNEVYDGQTPCVLVIKELDGNQYYKSFKEGENICDLRLLHDPLSCMYPHCNFSIWLNREKVTKENYDTTLKKNKKLRYQIRQDLALMVRRREIRIDYE